MAEITQNYITLPESDHSPRGRFHWLTLKEVFFKDKRPGQGQGCALSSKSCYILTYNQPQQHQARKDGLSLSE